MPYIRTEPSGQQKNRPFLRRSILQLLGLLLTGFHGTGTLAEDSNRVDGEQRRVPLSVALLGETT